jgi:hypothetical protein
MPSKTPIGPFPIRRPRYAKELTLYQVGSLSKNPSRGLIAGHALIGLSWGRPGHSSK